jgi:hypothetical protein
LQETLNKQVQSIAGDRKAGGAGGSVASDKAASQTGQPSLFPSSAAPSAANNGTTTRDTLPATPQSLAAPSPSQGGGNGAQRAPWGSVSALPQAPGVQQGGGKTWLGGGLMGLKVKV